MAEAPDIESEDMAIMFDTNVTGVINMTQTVLPIFKSLETSWWVQGHHQYWQHRRP